MKSIIYYFSATGNNLSIAKKLAEKLEDTQIRSIAGLHETNELIEGDKIGFIFPIYAWGMPLIVKEFIERATFRNVGYVYAVTGCGGIAGKTMIRFRNLIKKKGQKLGAGFILSEPSNGINVNNKSLMHKFIRSIRGNRPHRTIEDRMSEVIDIISNRKQIKVERDSFPVNQISDLINGMAVKVFKGNDRNYITTDKCAGCGNCVKICPRSNITLEDGKPVWLHNCEFCTACVHWCPNTAIEFGELSVGRKRYQKEGIRFEELVA